MAQQEGAPMTGMNVNWVALAAMLVVGVLALYSLYSGFQAYGSGNIEQAIYYVLMGVAGFAAIGYMLFRTRTEGEEKLKIEETEVITTLECPECNLKRVRDFQRGDYIFKKEPCTRCEGEAVITKIHRRKEEKKKAGVGSLFRPRPTQPEP
ncbi:MAG: hypothetical protein ACLFVP_02170 [Candidatus Bathyarchaeia archaeon]